MEKFPRRKKVYGKKTISTTSLSAVAFFTRDVTPPTNSLPAVGSKQIPLVRNALEDLTTALVNVKPADKTESTKANKAGKPEKRKEKREIQVEKSLDKYSEDGNLECMGQDEHRKLIRTSDPAKRKSRMKTQVDKGRIAISPNTSKPSEESLSTHHHSIEELVFACNELKLEDYHTQYDLHAGYDATKTKSGFENLPATQNKPQQQVQELSVDSSSPWLNRVILDDVSQHRTKETKPRRDLPTVEDLGFRVGRAINSRSVGLKEDSRAWLKPLTDAYEIEGRPQMTIRKWIDILDPEWSLQKIAESSYAEVYKVSNEDGTSVLKVMALKPPKGPGSQRETAVKVESVVSEVLIMDMMAEIPGFLEFKGAHIIEGKPPKAIIDAYKSHAAETESEFPKPGAYHKEQLFLALELGDAGVDIENFHIVSVAQLWDIFLKTVFALATGEAEFRFEHRDLHEGNVCIKQVSRARTIPKDQPYRLGYSGLEITLLDYTLSRAQNNNVVYLDLERDPGLFTISETLQHQMYRRMRIWAFFRAHGVTHPLFDSLETPSHGSWEEYMPYTNVIWLYYLLTTIIERYEGGGLEGFMEETEGLRSKIHPDRRTYDAGFESAMDVLAFCLQEGWMKREDFVE